MPMSSSSFYLVGGGISDYTFLLAFHFQQSVLVNDTKICLGYFSHCLQERFSYVSDANFSTFSRNFLLLEKEETMSISALPETAQVTNHIP